MNVIYLDSGHSFFKLPTVLKNVTEMKLMLQKLILSINKIEPK